MVTMDLVGIILAIFGGYILDHVFSTLSKGGFLDVPPNWQTMGGTFTIINEWYLVCGLFCVLGTAMFLKAIIRKTGQDNYISM